MDITVDNRRIQQILKRNKKRRKQTGQRIETPTAYCLRYYDNETGKQKYVTLAQKSDVYRCWGDVEPLIENLLRDVNEGVLPGGPRLSALDPLTDFVEHFYLPWCEETMAAPTVNSYKGIWRRYWKPTVGNIPLTHLSTAQVTTVLTEYAKRLGGRSLSHMKWMLSGVYGYAIAKGLVPSSGNPVVAAQWLHRVARPKTQAEYSLDTVLAMLRVLEPVNLNAAVAVSLCYFAALRPAEARGLNWTDYDGYQLNIKRSIWRNKVGETKTAESSATVPVIEPLRSLLEKLKAQSTAGYILQSRTGKPLSLDSLNVRVIAPTLKKAGINWRGYYPCRRGISSLVTDTSKNALNSTGLLRHSTPITALKHYTRAQKESIQAALEQIEQMAAKKETVQ